MKAILISIKPKWCALMMNGDKTVEVRKGTALYKATKKLIDEYGFAEFYVYCTKGNHHLVKPRDYDKYLIFTNGEVKNSGETSLNGKVIFKFRCYNVEEIITCERHNPELLHRSCLNANGFYDYLTKGKNFLGRVFGSAIHISNLEIFIKPKELSEFKRWCDGNFDYMKGKCLDCEAYRCDILADEYWCDMSRKCLTKAPQSYMFIEVD